MNSPLFSRNKRRSTFGYPSNRPSLLSPKSVHTPASTTDYNDDTRSVISAQSVPTPSRSRTSGASLSSFAVPSWGNSIGEHKSNVRVVAKIRPLSDQEASSGEAIAIFPDYENDDEEENSISYDESEECPSLVKSPVSSVGGESSVANLAAKFNSTASTPLIPSLITTPTKFNDHHHTSIPDNNSTPLHRNTDSSAPFKNNVACTSSSTRPSFIQPPSSQLSSNTSKASLEKSEVFKTKATSLSAKTKYGQKKFEYDTVIDSTTTQKEAYASIIGDAVRLNIYRGFNTTIITYGQQNSGKTFTMYGSIGASRRENKDSLQNSKLTDKLTENGDQRNDGGSISGRLNSYEVDDDISVLSHESLIDNEEDGIFSRAVHDLFRAKQRQSSGGDVSIHMTFIEVCNDAITDMLSHKQKKTDFVINDQDDGNTASIMGLTSVLLKSASHAKLLLHDASRRRSRYKNSVNENSIIFHTICTIHVKINPAVKSSVTSGKMAELTSTDIVSAKLTLVDLAGSSQFDKANKAISRRQALNVNKDLFTLERCISVLAKKANSNKANSSQLYVPFRDSKLTRILKDSLGGNCSTVMIACVSPSEKDLDGSMNTLEYAKRTKNITNSLKKNIVRATLTPAEGAALRRENMVLKTQIIELRNLQWQEEAWDTDSVEQPPVWKIKMEGEKEAAEIEIKKAKDNLSQIMSQLKDIDEQVKTLKVNKESLLSEINEVREEQSSKHKEKKAQLEREKDIAMNQLTVEREISVALQNKLLFANENLKREEQKRAHLEKQIQDLTETQKASIEIDMKTLQVESEGLLSCQESLKRVEEENSKLFDEVKTLKKRREEDIEHIRYLKIEVEELEESMQGQLVQYDEEKSDLNQEIQSVHDELLMEKEMRMRGMKDFESEATELRHVKKSIEDNLLQTQEELKQEQAQAAQMKEEMENMRKELELERERRINVENDSKDIVETLSCFRVTMDDNLLHITGALEREQEERIKAEKALENMEHDRNIEKGDEIIFEDLQDKLKASGKENQSIQAQLREKEKMIATETKRRAFLEKELEKLQSKVKSFQSQYKNALQDKSKNDSNRISRKPPLSIKGKSSTHLRLEQRGITTRESGSVESTISVSNLLTECDDNNKSFDSDFTASDSLNTDQQDIRQRAQRLLQMAEKSIDMTTSFRSLSLNASFSSAEFSQSQYSTSTSQQQQQLFQNGKENSEPVHYQLAGGVDRRSTIMRNMSYKSIGCTCKKSVFSGKEEQTEFFLPKLGLACTCGAEENQVDTNNPYKLSSFLRSWQVQFLGSVGVISIEELINAEENDAKKMVRAMKRWRHKNRFKSARTKACFIALHIWAKTAKSVQEKLRDDQSTSIDDMCMEINCDGNDDASVGSISTLGDSSFRQDMSMDDALFEGEFEV